MPQDRRKGEKQHELSKKPHKTAEELEDADTTLSAAGLKTFKCTSGVLPWPVEELRPPGEAVGGDRLAAVGGGEVDRLAEAPTSTGGDGVV